MPLNCSKCYRESPFLVTRKKRDHDGTETALALCLGCIECFDAEQNPPRMQSASERFIEDNKGKVLTPTR